MVTVTASDGIDDQYPIGPGDNRPSTSRNSRLSMVQMNQVWRFILVYTVASEGVTTVRDS